MEDNKTDSTSDRDKKMMGSFESYTSKREKAEKAKEAEAEKKRLRHLPGLFERPEEVEEVKDKNDVGRLFEAKKPEPEEESDETDADQEVEPDHEAIEGSLEELDAEEVESALGQYVEAQLPEVEAEAEASEPGSLEAEIAEADATLLRNIKETGSIEDGLDKTIEDLDLDDEDLAEAAEADSDTEEETIDEVDDDEQTAQAPTPPTPPTPSPPVAIPTPSVPPQSAFIPPNPFNTPNIPNTPLSPNAQPQQPNVDPSRRRQRTGDVLVGGIIGYLIGRRRGRIKTEAELLPIKNKLESEVKSLHEEIANKEEKIRKLAANKFEKTKEEKPLLQQHIENQDQQEALTRRSYESLNQSDYAKTRPERLGHVLVPKVELAPEKPDVSKLSIVELLGIAANIKRDNITVRQMFESGRLDALGLRRVVHEYLDGQNFERVLAENLKMMESHEHLSKPADEQQSHHRKTSSQTDNHPVSNNVSLPMSTGMAYGTQSYPSAQPDYYHIELQKRRAATVGIGIGLAIAVLVLFVLYLLI